MASQPINLSVCSVDATSCLCQDSEYMVAVRNYITENRTHLSFHKGDIIRLQHMDGLETGETHKHDHNKHKCTQTLWSFTVISVLFVLLWTFYTVSAYLCFMQCPSMCLCVCVCVCRQTLWLHCEEEGHASGGAQEGHS